MIKDQTMKQCSADFFVDRTVAVCSFLNSVASGCRTILFRKNRRFAAACCGASPANTASNILLESVTRIIGRRRHGFPSAVSPLHSQNKAGRIHDSYDIRLRFFFVRS